MSVRVLGAVWLMIYLCSSASAEIDERKLIDLTYPLDEQTIAWPTNKPFEREQTAWGNTAGGYWYASGQFSMSEHAGTHMDAPIHFAEGMQSVDKIPIQKLIVPAVVIDVSSAAETSRDYRLTQQDLEDWEARQGTIPPGAVVLMYTGWGARWPDREWYLGSVTPSDPKTLHFPGFSKEAAEFLVGERKIDGIGIDTPSIDYGPSQDFVVHQIVNGANLYGLENLANLDKLPPKGAILVALPIKIRGGTGGPVRVIAILP